MSPLLAAVLVVSVVAQPDGGTRTMFFPRGVLSEFEAEWYGKHLARMGEPSLVGAPASAHIYRFTLLPTWGHPVTVRLTLSQGRNVMEAKRLDGFGGYDPGKLVENSSATLTEAQVKDFQAMFGKLGFTKMAVDDPVRGLDGSQWILEAVENGKYHIAVRWTPQEYDTAKRGLTEFARVCEWLYRASPLRGDVKNKDSVEMEKSQKAVK